ncbi:MAG: Eco57I restriction-modification methylase domain-containing protein, partial [Prevotella sp.]
SYADLGEGYQWHDTITAAAISGDHADLVQPRAMKSRDEQQRRSRQMAEVFTPSWIVAKMNDVIDEEWNEQWHVGLDTDTDRSWQDYVVATRLEITCGEAPFLTSRYDTVSGAPIPPDRRVGILDRKLRKVSEHCTNADWTRWALLALGSVYGYEWQGDNLLLARQALLATFSEAYEQQFGAPADKTLLQQAAEIISWNIWQMDGLKAVVPDTCHEERHTSNDLFGSSASTTVTPCPGCAQNNILLHNGLRCRLRRWIASDDDLNNALPDSFDCLFTDFITKKYKTHHKTKWPMKFDFVIGNPPYQQESNGANANDTPIYHYFYDAAFKVSDHVELISPARFLFNAGGTPNQWNAKMLENPNFKVLSYEPKSSKIFPSTSINGGIAVTYYNKNEDFGAIGVFTAFPELNSILEKVKTKSKKGIDEIVSNRGLYKYSDIAFKEQPKEMEKTADRRIAPSSFNRMPSLFTAEKPNDNHEYIRIYGVVKNQRTFKWFRRDYIDYVENIDKYKVLVSKADGAAGTIGNPIPARIMGKPVLAEPGVGFTETFISIGETDSRDKAEHEIKYLKSKFARAMLSTLKVTQNNAKPTWKYVPLQNFTSSSDIDWSKSVHEID